MQKIIFILLALIISLKGYSQVKQTIIKESFYTNVNNWPEGDLGYKNSQISNGNYLLNHTKSNGSASFDIPTKLYPGRNFFIEATGKILSGEQDKGFGITWGKGKGGFYSFVITQEGKFYVRRVESKGEGYYLMYPTRSKFINKAPLGNTIRVQLQNEEYVFFINGKFVGHAPFKPFFGDNLGLILYGRQNVSVSNFGVYGTPKYQITDSKYTASLRVASYSIRDGINNAGFGYNDNRINRGEKVQMRVELRNIGQGIAKDLYAQIASTDGILISNGKEFKNLNDAAPGEVCYFDCDFFVPNDFLPNNISFNMDIADSKKQLAQTADFKVPLNTKIPRIGDDDENKEVNISLNLNFKSDKSDNINENFPITLKDSRNTYTVIIGIENYMMLPDAKYAKNDAEVFYKYATKILNIPKSNIAYLANEKANLTQIKSLFVKSGFLDNYATADGEIIVYFSGHGLADENTNTPYILPYNADVNNLEKTAIELGSITKALQNINTRQIICFFETSFGGLDRSGKSFVKDGGQFSRLPRLPQNSNSNICTMYASAGQEENPVENTYHHGIFTTEILSAIQKSASTSEHLDMQELFSKVSKGIISRTSKEGKTIVPKIDCKNKTIKIM